LRDSARYDHDLYIAKLFIDQWVIIDMTASLKSKQNKPCEISGYELDGGRPSPPPRTVRRKPSQV